MKLLLFNGKLLEFNNKTLALADSQPDIGSKLLVGGTLVNILRLNTNDFSTDLESGYVDLSPLWTIETHGDLIYYGGGSGNPNFRRIFTLNKNDLTPGISSPMYGGNIRKIVINGDFIYAGGESVRRIKKYNLSDLSFVGESEDVGGDIRGMVISGDYIYVGGRNRLIKKYNLNDLSYTGIQSPFFGPDVNSLFVHGDFIYGGGGGTLRQYNLSDLSQTYTSGIYGVVEGIGFMDGYILAGAAAGTSGSIYWLNPVDLSIYWNTPTLDAVYVLTNDENNVYVGGNGGFIQGFNKNDIENSFASLYGIALHIRALKIT